MSNPNFTPLDRANIRDFSPGLFITAVHRRRGRGRDTPEVWLLPTDKEPRLHARKTRLVSARPLRAPLHCLSCCPALLTRTQFRLYWRNLFGPGPAIRCRICWLDVQTAPSSSLFAHHTVRKRECTRRRRASIEPTQRCFICREYLDIINAVGIFFYL